MQRKTLFVGLGILATLIVVIAFQSDSEPADIASDVSLLLKGK